MKVLVVEDERRSRDCSAGPARRPERATRFVLIHLGSRVLVGGLLIGVVVLVTMLFSFLGTITCCVLFGMMMGGLRGSTTRAIPVSLICPAVTIALLQLPTPAVPFSKAATLAALCFAVFWGLCGLTHFLMVLENRGRPSPALGPARTGARPAAEDSPATESPTGAKCRPSEPCGIDASESRSSETGLIQLQGKWVSLNPPEPGGQGAEILEFRRAMFRFEREDAQAGVQVCWEGPVKCETLGPFGILRILNGTARAAANAATPWDGDQAYIYRVNEKTLTIGLHFGQDCTRQPAMKIYRRLDDPVPMTTDSPL